jgi:hypothetical protein
MSKKISIFLVAASLTFLIAAAARADLTTQYFNSPSGVIYFGPSSSYPSITGSLYTGTATNSAYALQSGVATLAMSVASLNSLSNNYIPKWNSSATTTVNSLLYDNGTNVGIGVTNPSDKLEVAGGNIVVDNAGAIGTSRFINFAAGRASVGWDGALTGAFLRSSDNTKPIMFGAGASEYMRITGTGNIGIGTTAPGYTLALNGLMGGSAGSSGGIDAASPNLLLNSSFENGTANLPTSWSSACGGGPTCTFTRDSSTAYSGSYSESIYRSAGGGGGGWSEIGSPTLNLVAGKTYSISFWAKNDGGGIQGQWNVTNPTSSTTYCSGNTFNLTSSWQYFTFSCVSSSTGTDGYIKLRAYNTTGGTVWYDDVDFSEGSVALRWSPGDLIVTNAGNVMINAATPANAKVTIIPNGQNFAIDAGGYKIGNIGMPLSGADAATKAYVDSFSSGGSNALWSGTTTSNIWSTNVGNVGIGTTAPNASLNVVSSMPILRLGNSTAINSVGSVLSQIDFTDSYQMSGAEGRIAAVRGATGSGGFYPTDLVFSAMNNGSTLIEAMRIRYNSNVGIGTTNPGNKLSVSGDVGIIGANKLILASDLTNPAYIKGRWVDNNNSGIDFHVFNASVDTTSLSLRENGFVGIGLTNPAYKLDVNGTVNINGALTQGGAIAYLGNYNLAGTNYPRSGNDLAIGWNWTNGSRDMSFWNTDVSATAAFSFKQLTGASSKSDLLTILSNGNVGIGTVYPAAKLQVIPASGYAIDAGNYKIGNLAVPTASNDAVTKAYVDSTGANTLWGGTAAGNAWSNNSGNIGIGTTNPGQKLEVNGTIYANNSNGVLVPNVSSAGGRSIYTDSVNGYAIVNWGNHSWFRNGSSTWTFQGGSGGDDWTQTAQLYLNAVGTAGANDKLIELGQRQSNNSSGDYKGLRVVQFSGSSIQDGYLQAGNASFSGTVNVGSISLNSETNKITAETFDPVYTINNKHYATYLPGMTGVKEETAATLTLNCVQHNCSQTLDFKNLPVASDLWLFAQATNLTKNFDQLSVLLSSGFKGSVWYDKNEAKKTVTIRAVASDSTLKTVEVSYRLTAPRFDSASWSNFSQDDTEGFNLDLLK